MKTDEEIITIANEWASKLHDRESERTSTISEAQEWQNRMFNFHSGYKQSQSDKQGEAVAFAEWYVKLSDLTRFTHSTTELYTKFINRET